MLTLLLIAAVAQPGINPRQACEAAAHSLRDMRYTEYGKYAARKDLSHPNVQARIARCIKIATIAAPHGADVVFVSIAIGFNETNFREGVKGKYGEVGMMHVMPYYSCRPYKDLDDGKKGCTNPIRAGVRRVRLALKNKTWEQALRSYNGSTAYGKKVAGYARAIKRAYNLKADNER